VDGIRWTKIVGEVGRMDRESFRTAPFGGYKQCRCVPRRVSRRDVVNAMCRCDAMRCEVRCYSSSSSSLSSSAIQPDGAQDKLKSSTRPIWRVVLVTGGCKVRRPTFPFPRVRLVRAARAVRAAVRAVVRAVLVLCFTSGQVPGLRPRPHPCPRTCNRGPPSLPPAQS
jgi:hypothetical protein